MLGRACTGCLGLSRGLWRLAAYVARGADGGEWFECGEHHETENVAGIRRVALVPIDEWYERHGLPVPGKHAWRVTLCDLLRGRVLRLRAREWLEAAMSLPELAPPFDPDPVEKARAELLDRAGGFEWLAKRIEQGEATLPHRWSRAGIWPGTFEEEIETSCRTKI